MNWKKDIVKKKSNIEDYCIGKLINKWNLSKNKAVKEKEKQKGRRKYLKVSVLRWRKRNVNPKEEEVNVAVEAKLYPKGTVARETMTT